MPIVIDGLGNGLSQGIGEDCPENPLEFGIRFQHPEYGFAALMWQYPVPGAGIFDPECPGIERRILRQRLDAPGNLTGLSLPFCNVLGTPF